MLELPRFKAAAVQTSPVFLNTDATVEKTISLIQEAAGNGAKLVAFPEVFISGYPYWSWIGNPIEGSSWFERLVRSAIEIPGPEINKIAQAAARHKINVVIGVNERNRNGIGTLYNTLVTISEDGKILGRHRKLVPTWAEKLTWAPGDASALRVHETSVGPLGSLACGENTNTLARFSLIAQGELIHVASYISLPVAPSDYDMADAIKVRAAAHCFEGKLFTAVSCSTVSEEIIEALEKDFPRARELLTRKNSAFSGFLGPDGRVIGEPLIDEEGIVYADIDLSRCIQPRQMHDIAGHYNRFDIFDLKVNRSPQQAVRFDDEPAEVFSTSNGASEQIQENAS
ncbi:carbon-nitrogen hydrolase family protein [Pseudomonas sp. CFBP 8770]|uniref:carbon-nitrogen hydrolase family protein n=1 Tax=unclassified Pseudomonas TaxID=196821 RepID=UPI0017803AD0|nr:MULTISPECIES: carbon-nitrogen hydrolase family protein [unclassified Pseudomonas]MBD8473197.1 carbon-nitrogen hydrolase family protein [Pseudomonas sp. CFBP 8773]MBD8595917.1 carbon-nitrogen hydrolase family protein [Pseudomonas sp. CFBP 8758]MBD8646324.1 carbon-nitrogen hydrolase family protein [Pseudomonas sp. CFBP 8770]MBD8733544.1 carbon-nitrogen hydrolase family protein [Pseudomonas sp. CFBP 13710]